MVRIGQTEVAYELRRSAAASERRITVTPGHVEVLALTTDDDAEIDAFHILREVEDRRVGRQIAIGPHEVAAETLKLEPVVLPPVRDELLDSVGGGLLVHAIQAQKTLQAHELGVCLRVMERALALLANPAVQYVMRQPSPGMATMSKNLERKGEEPVADMKIVHLTKRIYLDGQPVGGQSGSHASPKPHDREGHYRTRATALPGWEGPFIPSSGDFKGMTRYRRWFDKTTVMGGAPEQRHPGRGHPKGALPNAPQFRVVK